MVNTESTDQQNFLAQSSGATAGTGRSTGPASAGPTDGAQLFSISLAQWSLNTMFKAKGGDLDNLDFARTSREEFDIDTIEYSSQMFQDKAGEFHEKHLAQR